MIKSGFSVLLTVLIFGAIGMLAQTPTQTPRPSVNRLENLRPLNDKDDIDFSRRTSLENLPAEYRVSSKAMKRTKFTDEEKESFKDAKKDGIKLLKILIAPKCAEKFVIDVSDQRCAEIYDFIPISYYSFFDGIHGQLYADLRIVEDSLIAGRGRYIQGFLIDLGETDIGTLDKKSPQVEKLARYAVAKTSEAVDKQSGDLEKGIAYEGDVISSKKKILVNHTYLMRVVAYGMPNEMTTPYNYDLTLVLRIEKLSDDNMAIISWKKFSSKMAPRIQDSKKNKSDNFEKTETF